MSGGRKDGLEIDGWLGEQIGHLREAFLCGSQDEDEGPGDVDNVRTQVYTVWDDGTLLSRVKRKSKHSRLLDRMCRGNFW